MPSDIAGRHLSSAGRFLSRKRRPASMIDYLTRLSWSGTLAIASIYTAAGIVSGDVGRSIIGAVVLWIAAEAGDGT